MLNQLLALADALRHRGRSQHWPDDHALGRRGEDIAHRFLQRTGMLVVGRNYRMESGAGELDLIGWDHETLVFVEVKTRAGDEHGAPDRAIGPEKLRTLIRTAQDYARHSNTPWENVRFDSVTVLLRTPPAVTHFKDVIPMQREAAVR
jgi:putative endonuclease